MSFFKRPAVLIILSLILILSSTVLSVRAKLGAKSDDVTEIFYADQAQQPSLAALLREIVTQADSIAAIAEDYNMDVDELYAQISWLDMSLRYNRGNESYIYGEYSGLLKCLQSFHRQLDNAALSAHDREHADDAFAQIDERVSQITALASEYNGFVRTFNRRYGGFPASFMADLAGVRMPEEFA